MTKKDKVRVNITVDKDSLEKAKKKLELFGGKLSTLFNAYLTDFVSSMDKNFDASKKEIDLKLKEIDERLERIEKVKQKK